MARASFGGFLQLLLGGFFRWWWAAVTGVASILSYLAAPETFMLSRVALSLLVFAAAAVLFLSVSAINQSWQLYTGRAAPLRLVRWQRSQEYGGEFVFIIDDGRRLNAGAVLELRRFCDNVEVPVALVEVLDRNANGHVQAQAIWSEPAHVRDYKSGALALDNIIVSPIISIRTLRKARERIVDA